jgi:hypothetical protein
MISPGSSITGAGALLTVIPAQLALANRRAPTIRPGDRIFPPASLAVVYRSRLRLSTRATGEDVVFTRVCRMHAV